MFHLKWLVVGDDKEVVEEKDVSEVVIPIESMDHLSELVQVMQEGLQQKRVEHETNVGL